MKGRRKLTVRLWGGLLAVLMLWSVLSVSTIALATGTDKAVTVTWAPAQQTTNGTREVNLTAQLTQDAQGVTAAAMVEIFLTAEEAAALQWEGTTIEESALDAPTGGEQDQGSVPESKPNPEDQTEPQQDPDSQQEGQTDPQPDTQAEPQPQPETDKDTSGTVEGQGMENGTPETTPANQPPAVEETDLSTSGEEETPAQVSVQSRTGGEQAVLIKKDDDSAVLRILLTGSNSYQTDLLFAPDFSGDDPISLSINSIVYKTYQDVESLPNIQTAPLLNDGISLSGSKTSFTVYKTIPAEITVSAGETVNLDSDNKNITYTIQLQKIAAGDDGKDYTFAVTLPEDLSLPAGALSHDSNSNSIKCGDTAVANLTLPSGLSIKEGSLSASDNGFIFTVTAPTAEEGTTEIETHEISLTLDGSKLVRSAEAISGNVTLTVGSADTESKTASVSVTAGDVTLPGEGGWTVTVTKSENKNQNVFWRDNETPSARPEGWDNYVSGFWPTNAKLYYTLTDQSGVTYQRTLLTNDEDALAKVSLTAYPTFAAYGAHGFTVEDLPTKLKQTDPNNPNSVLNTYTVSWSLEPPASVDGYDFRNITSDQVGEGKDYPSISTPGWYYMQEDTFTFTLDIRQGDETPLEENPVDKLRALLGNFQFNWSYTGGDGYNGIIDMIEEGNAVPSYYDGVVEITGMWKYNVDGSPINYSVTEIEDDADSSADSSADGKITTDELGNTTGLLKEDEWYQIQYVNTGVPGEGQDTTALHSGGTLQLVRQGNTQYEATKIWLDSYGDGENSGRPNATFTLYRYRKGEVPSTAAPVKDYTVALTQKTNENDDSTGGYAVQVMTGSGTDAELADLPKYDTLDGAEFIYVVRETLSGPNAGQYEQVFGTVSVDENGTIEKEIEKLPEGALAGDSTDRPSGNTYLYNDGTLTNYQKDTIPVTATKTWKAAAYQSQFNDVAVELTLQYRVKGSDDPWQTYTSEGKSVIRYLHRFYAESLSDTLVERPSMPRYQTTTLDVSNKELEYRWLETAVYTDAENATETDLGGAKDRIDITYPDNSDNSATNNTPVGSFTMNGSNYTVSYAGSANNTQITNSVAEYLDYEIIKEWRETSTPDEITIQILRSVAGGEFEDYLEFTMNAEENAETVTVSQTLPENSATPEDASPKFKIEGKTVDKDTDANTPLEETWNALVSGLPRFDEQGRPYEYLLLEANAIPTYETKIDSDTGNYKTTVINGGPGDGFNLLVRKVWLDDGDMEHRAPVTLTLYNKNTNEPVMKKNGDGSASTTPYTITLGGNGEENLWHKVVWISTSELANTDTESGDTKFDADDVYLVETQVGTAEVDHKRSDTQSISYEYLYPKTPTTGGEIFEVTTENHRYQVSYQQDNVETSTDPAASGVNASFTITNRRLGSIDLTVTKKWVDGREGDTSQVLNDIQTVLEEYANDSNNSTRLALAFRLVFDESMANKPGTWYITYSGPSVHSDTVCVGGEKVQIYSTYQKEDEKGAGYKDPGSSEQIILGYVKGENGWEIQTSASASFLGLPKYDTDGEIVAYSIEEVWLDVTTAGVDGNGKITPPEVVDFKDPANQEKYSELYALWQDFSADYKWGEYKPDVDGTAHTRDEQELEVTNIRRGSKDVTWTVEWQDDFTHNSDLRPDIYLDIYQVTYTYDKETGAATPVISRVTGRTIDWDMDKSESWTATLSGVPAFDEKGNEIFYYAVQRTVMAAGDYDYQAALYEMNGAELGTRDEPAEGIAALNGGSTDSPTTSITDANGNPYDLAVLGKRDGDTEDTVDSIQWGSGQPVGIGSFGGNSNYPKYALLEGGTIINTLAETYTIEGVKYWTNLPTGWEDTRLPQVTFTVSRYTEEDKDNAEEVAKVVISSDLWQELKSGTQYKYLIQYEGINVLGKETADKNENRINGEVYVKEVLDMDTGEKITNPTPLARYEVGTGALWTYEVEETIDWDQNKPDNGHQVFDSAPSGTGFTFTNNYDPTEGSIQVKKFLYLPMGDDGNPEAYPAVTFKLTRQVSYGDDENGNPVYVADKSFETQTVTLTSAQVEQIWKNSSETPVKRENLVVYGKDTGTNPQYIWATLQFTGLDIYAPNGTEYQYSVAEDRTYLQGYDTWGKAGDVTENNLSTAFDNTNKLENVTDTTVTTAIEGLEPEENDTTVDATFKNQRTNPQEKLELFTATKIWEDNDSAFRPETKDFAKLLTLTRTAAKQGGTGGAVGIEEVLTLWDDTTDTGDYEIQIAKDSTDANKWTITIEPANGKTFEKYAPNGMPWTYTLKERVDDGRLQLYQANEGGTLTEAQQQANKIYTPSTPTPNSKTNGEWQYTITSTTPPVSGNDPATYSFGSLTNSIMTLAKFEKKWVDAEGNPITQDYLGFDLTVDFQLQVREMGSNENWVKASEWTYDGGKALGLAEGADVHSLTGRVVGANHNWTYTFEDLPGVVQDSEGNYIFLEYRVIETKVSWGDGSQTIELPTGDTGNQDSFTYEVNKSLVTGAAFSRTANTNTSTSTNTLSTREVSVTKVWDDNDNQYGTRPGGEGPWSWGAWFVLQRTTEENPTEDDWENVALFEQLYGNNAESGSDTNPAASGSWEANITGLPIMDYSGTSAQPYTYRVRELQPLIAGESYSLATENDSAAVTAAIVPEGGTYNPDGFHYTATYDEPTGANNLWTVTNSMDTPTGEVPKNVVAIKEWAGENNTGVTSITFQLKYSYTDANGKTVWGPADFLSGGQWEKTANAGNDWRVSWEDLPETDNSGRAVTGYQVVEKAGSGWVQIGKPKVTHNDTTGTTTYSYTFTNSITTNYSVEKVWQPDTPSGVSVTLGLYRTTESAKVGSTTGTLVPVDELDSTKGVRTVTLDGNSDTTETTAWNAIFTNLPKYDTNGNLYYYYALELDGRTPIGQNGKLTLGTTDYEVSYNWAADNTKTTVTNTTATSLTGTKTWKDNSNRYNTRPTGLTLVLQRRIAGGSWSQDLAGTYPPTWSYETNSDANVWTYTFSGLPSCDSNGNVYTYRVREEVPNGYKLENPKTNGESGEVDKTNGHYDFTNVLSGTVTIVGQKIWSGGVGTKEPTLTLEQRLSGSTDEISWTQVSNASPTWSKPEGSSTWTFTYSDLDKYNGDGVLYEYRVRENPVPDDYEAGYTTGTVAAATPHPATSVDGLTITNYKDGSLTVSKTVSGNRGETDRAFHFTVTLTGRSSAGTQAADVDGEYTAVYTNQDGSTEEKAITFTGGKSEAFTLKHNESLTIQNLPAGIGYTVTEKEANQDGYSTTVTGWTGTIPTGDTAKAAFENYRNSSSPSNQTNVTGTKTWVGDTPDQRPTSLELTLYRSVDGGPEQVVSATPIWTKTGNVWTYRYANLPKYDSSGKAYTYRVVETVPEGYVSTVSGNNFTNTLTKEEEKITLTGTKRWLGDTAEDRPESITVVLYDGGGQEVRRVTVTAAEDWRYTFADLPKYDAQGGEIQYYVREEGVPPGYQVSYDGLNIVNRKEDAVGGLRVTKQVTGTGAEYDREFSFTVTLEDTTINGTYGEMTFVDGVATFTLRHGQSFTAVGLPAGLSYTVTESVPEDYTAADASQAGEIPASGLETVTVVNNRDLPDEPDGPDNPDTPDTPDTPSKPDGPDDPQGPEVQTGDRANPALYGGLSALFAAGLASTLYWGRKGRKDDL